MILCQSCRHSFSVHDHEFRQVLMCWPGGDRHKEQIARAEECSSFEREDCADEVEV